MADVTMLTSVKNALGITGTAFDDTLTVYIDEVTDYMSNAGCNASVIAASAGVVARGVNDLWNNQAGAAKLSPYFYDRVSQLALKSR